MPIVAVMADTSADPGEKLDPVIRAEIDILAPSTIDTGDIATNMLADQAVTSAKISPGAVGSTQIAEGGVATANIADGAVGTAELANGAVTADKAGVGTVACRDTAGNALQSTEVFCDSTYYNGLVTPDANTTYYVTA
jgi:hypothetical protein